MCERDACGGELGIQLAAAKGSVFSASLCCLDNGFTEVLIKVLIKK